MDKYIRDGSRFLTFLGNYGCDITNGDQTPEGAVSLFSWILVANDQNWNLYLLRKLLPTARTSLGEL
jgi:hypothetical protein